MYYIIERELSGATEKTFGAKAPDAQARRRHWLDHFPMGYVLCSMVGIRHCKRAVVRVMKGICFKLGRLCLILVYKLSNVLLEGSLVELGRA